MGFECVQGGSILMNGVENDDWVRLFWPALLSVGDGKDDKKDEEEHEEGRMEMILIISILFLPDLFRWGVLG